MLSAFAQENPNTQQSGYCVHDFFKEMSETLPQKETNAYCSPTIPTAGSGTWLACGMTPHP